MDPDCGLVDGVHCKRNHGPLCVRHVRRSGADVPAYAAWNGKGGENIQEGSDLSHGDLGCALDRQLSPVGLLREPVPGVTPTFTVFGLDPSFAPTIFLYWIGGQLTLNLGFYLLQDEWLSEKDWNDFCDKARMIKEGKQV